MLFDPRVPEILLA